MSATAADMARQPEVLAALPLLTLDAVAAARDLLTTARTVRLAALGSSRHAAGYGAVALDVLAGVPATVLPAIGCAVPLPATKPGDVIVAVSQSGATPALVDLIARAKEHGGRTIAIVNAEGSPLAELCDVTLPCNAGPEKTVAATTSVTAQMLLLRLLVGPLLPSDVNGLAEAVAQTLILDPYLPTRPPAHVVAGGFAAEWIADEAALKFAEMAGVLPAAESVVDHLHGPVAVVTPTLALLSDADPNADPLLDAAHVFTAGPSPAYDVLTPTTGEESLDAIVRVVTAQLLALRWASALHVDPDDARGLTKVTATR